MLRSWFHRLIGWLLASRDRSYAEFGAFAAVLRGADPRVPEPLSLLSMSGPDVGAVIERIEQALGACDPAPGVDAMFASPDWRPHLIAATALLLDGRRRLDPAAMWRAIDAGSWVTPQLVATAYLIDPAFVERLRERIESGCGIAAPPGLSRAQRYRATGPASVEERSAKLLTSLLRMGARVPSLVPWLRGVSKQPRLAALQTIDRDQSGNIADNWLCNVMRQFQARGRALSPVKHAPRAHA